MSPLESAYFLCLLWYTSRPVIYGVAGIVCHITKATYPIVDIRFIHKHPIGRVWLGGNYALKSCHQFAGWLFYLVELFLDHVEKFSWEVANKQGFTQVMLSQLAAMIWKSFKVITFNYLIFELKEHTQWSKSIWN